MSPFLLVESSEAAAFIFYSYYYIFYYIFYKVWCFYFIEFPKSSWWVVSDWY